MVFWVVDVIQNSPDAGESNIEGEDDGRGVVVGALEGTDRTDGGPAITWNATGVRQVCGHVDVGGDRPPNGQDVCWAWRTPRRAALSGG